MSGEEPIVAGMAGRYASALFELAGETKNRDRIGEDLRRLSALIAGSDDLRRLIRSPLYDRDDQARAMNAVLDRLGVDALTRKFVGLVTQKRRLFALPDIIRSFEALATVARGELKARVTSARPLSQSQIQDLTDTLRASLKREIKLDAQVDERVLGGLVVRVGSRMIDSSLATKLDRLRLAMREA